MNKYLGAIVLILSSAALKAMEPQWLDCEVAVMFESETVAGSPQDVKKKLREKLNDRVSILRIEKPGTVSTRASAENIFDPMTGKQALEEIIKFHPDDFSDQDLDNQE